MTTAQQGKRQADPQTALEQAASAALIERAEALVREIEFDMDRAARHWRRANVDIRAATAKLSAAQEAEARRCFEEDLREADRHAAEARVAPTSMPTTAAMNSPMDPSMHSSMNAPTGAQREGDVPTISRGAAPRKLRNLV